MCRCGMSKTLAVNFFTLSWLLEYIYILHNISCYDVEHLPLVTNVVASTCIFFHMADMLTYSKLGRTKWSKGYGM